MLEHLFNKKTDHTPHDNTLPLPDLIELPELRSRVRQLQSADPDPYGLHGLSLEHNYLLTGYYLI